MSRTRLSSQRAALLAAYRGDGDELRALRAVGYSGPDHILRKRWAEAVRDPRFVAGLRERGIELGASSMRSPAPAVTVDGEEPEFGADPKAFYEATLADEGQPWERRQRAAERLEQVRRRDAPTDSIGTYQTQQREWLAKVRAERDERAKTYEGAATELNALAPRLPPDVAAEVRELAKKVAARAAPGKARAA